MQEVLGMPLGLLQRTRGTGKGLSSTERQQRSQVNLIRQFFGSVPPETRGLSPGSPPQAETAHTLPPGDDRKGGVSPVTVSGQHLQTGA